MPCLLCPSLLCCLLLLLFPLASSSASKGDTVVRTSSGPIKGKQVLAGLGSVTAYLGIPYAEPPLGKLRFQKPLPHPPWKQTLEATSFGNSCLQFIFQDVPEADMWSPKTPLSEDCLSLNIWVPHPQPSSPVPVLVWIHGGGYIMGTSSLELYNGAPLAATENVIVVTINYRLGALGFLYLPPAAPGNLGLWDQQLALKWVKENAAAFGGDPSRVTIFGHSAGGSSVHFHLLARKSQDLFAQAVIQSGTANAFWVWRSPEEAKKKSLEFVHLLGCSEDNNISIVHCLQTKNVSELNRHEIALLFKGGFLMNFPFTATTDGEFLLGDPEKLMEEGQIQAKPVLIGKTSDEGAPFVYYVFPNITHNLINQEQLLKGIRMLVPNATEDFIRTIALKYSEGNHGPAQYRSAMSHFYTDRAFACTLKEAAGNIRKTGSPVYAYLYTHRLSGSVWPEWIGASHGAEIPFVFGTLQSMLPVNQTYTEAEARLSRKMMYYWAEFARTGNPTGLAANKDEWALYNATEQNFFLLNTEPFQERVKEHCDFLKSHFSKAEEIHKSEGDSVSSD
ncbi:cholinesterase-like isoform X3 [Pantherophis guttatus]|uniref:Carboxylic ester hydrolase n=1 Tax=Pantherophis guttatus TaxID=94885 RepID=A0ABM3ZFL5_PANGU|nr:cholinesterase-like isoform X1 [Pantherophis guttatus]XP_060547141.1 cholinesterase-like isoform X1 [Pantherophis guttatus]XP_060547146.1 cholinesterase-like isoform X1 [Pantherophis guttatus]XP_060547159.1 cholinesterase-like isoform X1 [Pantherophis guttatus]XP_060547164.1 cholinesterase-like isoform X1 [Pantherophis guttatus]XP_060547169.1 cholinesterase-like isoform X3 [Pantherophis guttatus]